MKIEKLLNEIALLRMLCGKRIRGQVLVFYALMMPIFLLCVGVALDLGWYYLNVSRLQNAADAAVLAGAYKLVEQDKFSNYFVKVLRNPPNDIAKYEKVRFNTEIAQLNMADGEEVAKRYSGKNLGHIVAGDSMKIFDDWNTSPNKDHHEVTLSAALYAKLADAQWNENGIRYYGVTLEEKVAHLFLRNFEPMDAIVTAYVMLQPHDVDLITVIKKLEDTKVIANWQYQNQYADFDGNWNHYRQTVDGKKAVSYVAGDYFRTETVNVQIDGGSLVKNDSAHKGTKFYGEYDKYGGVDSLNIDFNQDIQTQFSVDWDLGADLPAGKTLSYVSNAKDHWDENNGADLRIQGRINIRDAWKNRHLMDEDTSNDLTPDILWVRIESDPWWSTKDKMPWITGNTSSEGWNTVHQMIISIDKDNTSSTDKAYNKSTGKFDGYDIDGGLAYEYRPLFIFYKGPETYNENNTVRQSQPVILNLNTDFNGILYAPNSPVVILGNDKKLTGFVVAKEFVQLKTVKDYTDNGYSEYQDKNGKPMLIESDKVYTAAKLDEEYPAVDYKKSIDNETGTVTYINKQVPKYFIVEAQYVKGMSGYTDNNYVAALKEYRSVTDNDIIEIKFPDKDAFNAENNHQIYHVVEADLLNESNLSTEELNKQTNKSTFTKAEYAKVIVVSTGETKYIAKKNLPYVRMYIYKSGDKYPYVPVCDLKVAKDFPSNIYSTNGATLADDDHNVYKNKNIVSGLESFKVDDSLDMWKVVAFKSEWWNYYDSNASTPQITKIDDNGMKCFTSITENPDVTVTYTYNKIGDEADDAYVSDKLKYYTYYDYHTNQDGIDVDKGNLQTVIRLVMDNKGNVQTKALDAGSSEPITNDYKFQPDDPGWNKKTLNLETWEKNKDYRLEGYEVLYHKSAFNLSEESCYSYFQIPTLHRINYTYMNVDELNHTSEKTGSDWNVEDMFFTTRRANWID